jgi:tRNA pseudouridine38-40 synthase
VAFDTTRELPAHRWLLALNRYLPPDAAVQHVAACEPNYNPRFDALDKTYRYLFHLGMARDPLLRNRAWHLLRSGFRVQGEAWLGGVGAMLDLEAMRATCSLLVGTHDFRAFRSIDDTRENAQRTLHRVQLMPEWHGQPTLLALEVQGNAFMKNMVRILAGTLISVGRGKLNASAVRDLLCRDATRSRHSDTAPPHGLTLVQVRLGRLREAPSR